ncbi:hypothetical protein BDW67DRAFT_129224 [Aspergillus spinulosporus]
MLPSIWFVLMEESSSHGIQSGYDRTQYNNIQQYVITSSPLTLHKGKPLRPVPIFTCFLTSGKEYLLMRISPYVTHITNPGSDLLRLNTVRTSPFHLPGLKVLVIRNNHQSHSLETRLSSPPLKGKGADSKALENETIPAPQYLKEGIPVTVRKRPMALSALSEYCGFLGMNTSQAALSLYAKDTRSR